MEQNNNLYNKVRPVSFDEVYGNAELIEALQSFVSNKEKCPQAFLFTGPSGCGKTTIGKILSTELGCTGDNFREIDSGQFRGIDTVREIRQNMKYKPIGATCRVWLIDEVHKATNDAQNAMLKMLESTPPHVYFILCTTEPQKLIEPLKNRCSQFQVETLNETDLSLLIRKTARIEGVKLEKEVLEQIVKDSLGSGRNALMILQKVLAVNTERRLEMAKQAASEQNQVIDLCRVLFENTGWKAVAGILNGLKDRDPEEIRRSILGYASAVLLKNSKQSERAALIIETFWESTWNTGFPGIVYNCFECTK